MFVFGLTGGIGCGKTTVAKMFAQHGVTVLNTDEIGRKILDDNTEEARQVKARFPDCIKPSGSIHRQALASVIFADFHHRLWLEDLLHPSISRRVFEHIEELRLPSQTLAIVEGAVLLESRTRFDLSGMIVVTAPLALRIDRVKKRDGYSIDMIKHRIDVQSPEWEKILKADYLIDNSGCMEYTSEQVQKTLHLLAREMGGAQ